MIATHQGLQTTWLKTDEPVLSCNASLWKHVDSVATALRKGVEATVDEKRPSFYEMEIGGHGYYVHIPTRIPGVYLVAVTY